MGLSDPFVSCMVDGVEVFKTDVIKKTVAPAWEQNFRIPCHDYTKVKMEMICSDYNKITKNVMLGKCKLAFKELPFANWVPLGPRSKPCGELQVSIDYDPWNGM